MAKKKDNYWILISLWVACIIMSTLVYVAMNAATHNAFLSVTVTVAVAVLACICVWQIFTQLDNMVPKSERERIKAVKLAEEERKKQLANQQPVEITKPEPPQQPIQIEVHNTVLNQHEIVNHVHTDIENHVVNDITNNNINVAQANATAVAPTEVTVEAPIINVEAPKPTPTTAPTPQSVSQPKTEQPASEPEPIIPPVIEEPQIDTSVNPEKYESLNRAFQQKQREKTIKMRDCVVEYIHITMAPYMLPTEIEKLGNEVMLWADSTTYEPQPVKVQGRLSTTDVYHFIWNIAERLSTDRKYTGDDKAKFIKLLFPTICSDVEISSISRNLKVKPREGNIHIDEMVKGRIDFHYDPDEE
jgi:hypothetical protein